MQRKDDITISMSNKFPEKLRNCSKLLDKLEKDINERFKDIQSKIMSSQVFENIKKIFEIYQYIVLTISNDLEYTGLNELNNVLAEIISQVQYVVMILSRAFLSHIGTKNMDQKCETFFAGFQPQVYQSKKKSQQGGIIRKTVGDEDFYEFKEMTDKQKKELTPEQKLQFGKYLDPVLINFRNVHEEIGEILQSKKQMMSLKGSNAEGMLQEFYEDVQKISLIGDQEHTKKLELIQWYANHYNANDKVKELSEAIKNELTAGFNEKIKQVVNIIPDTKEKLVYNSQCIQTDVIQQNIENNDIMDILKGDLKKLIQENQNLKEELNQKVNENMADVKKFENIVYLKDIDFKRCNNEIEKLLNDIYIQDNIYQEQTKENQNLNEKIIQLEKQIQSLQNSIKFLNNSFNEQKQIIQQPNTPKLSQSSTNQLQIISKNKIFEHKNTQTEEQNIKDVINIIYGKNDEKENIQIKSPLPNERTNERTNERRNSNYIQKFEQILQYMDDDQNFQKVHDFVRNKSKSKTMIINNIQPPLIKLGRVKHSEPQLFPSFEKNKQSIKNLNFERNKSLRNKSKVIIQQLQANIDKNELNSLVKSSLFQHSSTQKVQVIEKIQYKSNIKNFKQNLKQAQIQAQIEIEENNVKQKNQPNILNINYKSISKSQSCCNINKKQEIIGKEEINKNKNLEKIYNEIEHIYTPLTSRRSLLPKDVQNIQPQQYQPQQQQQQQQIIHIGYINKSTDMQDFVQDFEENKQFCEKNLLKIYKNMNKQKLLQLDKFNNQINTIDDQSWKYPFTSIHEQHLLQIDKQITFQKFRELYIKVNNQSKCNQLCEHIKQFNQNFL